MFSRILLVFFTFSISVVCSSRTLGPSPDNSRMRFYLVRVDPALYHNDCKKYEQLIGKVLHKRRPPKGLIVHCYKHVTSGFAAALTEKQAEKMKGEEGVTSVTTTIYNFDVGPYDYYDEPEDSNN